MLSRVADSLYWLSRHIERAENLARLVDVARHDLLDMVGAEATESFGRRLIYTTGVEAVYERVKEEVGGELDVATFLTFADSNPDSISGCIATARENARVVRDQISEEMWVELNSVHLSFQSGAAETLWRREPGVLYRDVIKFSLMFQGLTDATILHGEGWNFVQLGKFIERADKTSRILDLLTYHGRSDRSEMASVLRSCSGLSAFREEYRGDVTLDNVAGFLLHSQSFPRSVRFCVRQLDMVLHAISGVPIGTYSNEAERLTGQLMARLSFTSMEAAREAGLHQMIDELQVSLNEIGQHIFETYVLLPSEVRSVAASLALQPRWAQQQQQQ